MKYVYCMVLVLSVFTGKGFTAEQTSMVPDEAMLTANQEVMTALMRRLQQEPDDTVRRTLILDHMTHMDTYISHLLDLHNATPDHQTREHINVLFHKALTQTGALLRSVVSDGQQLTKAGTPTDRYYSEFDQRMRLLHNMMNQTIKVQMAIDEQDSKQ